MDIENHKYVTVIKAMIAILEMTFILIFSVINTFCLIKYRGNTTIKIIAL